LIKGTGKFSSFLFSSLCFYNLKIESIIKAPLLGGAFMILANKKPLKIFFNLKGLLINFYFL